MEARGLPTLQATLDLEAILRFSVLSSGSSGNATYLEAGGRGLLLDAGFSCRTLRKLLARIGRDPSDVSAVLLTHGHADHTAGVRSLLREFEVALYAAPGVAEAVAGATPVKPGET